MTTSITVKDHTGADVTIDLPAGAPTDAAVTDPTASGSLVALAKGKLTLLGGLTETAPASDTASSGLNGRLQRLAQTLTLIKAQLPGTLAQKTKALSLAVTLASDEDLLALMGPVNETAPATDTASSGLNGRLQRIAQRISSVIGTAGSPSTNVFTVQGVASGTPITAGGNVGSAATDSGNPVKVGGVYTSTLPTFTTGQRADVQFSARGSVRTTMTGITAVGADGLGTNLSFLVSEAAHTATGPLAIQGFVFNGTTVDRVRKAAAASTKRLLSAAASTNGDFAKASAGDVYGVAGYNAAASVRYLKLYNKASAPTVGTDTPVLTLALAPSSAFRFEWSGGLYFSTGIAFALTTGAPDNDTGALTAADVVGLNIVIV